jgi:ring-1,2-phenylacetyl-CoA epoxidase subunit PaaB
MSESKGWPLFEIFIRARAGLDHKHVGSVHAVDARMALEHARDVYAAPRGREHLGRALDRHHGLRP